MSCFFLFKQFTIEVTIGICTIFRQFRNTKESSDGEYARLYFKTEKCENIESRAWQMLLAGSDTSTVR